MDDTAYKNALARKVALQKEIQEIDYFLEMYEKFAPTPGTRFRVARPDYQPDFMLRSSSDGRAIAVEAKVLPKKLGPSEYADIAERYIEAAGHPLTRTELVSAFEREGIDLPSPDKARYLGTILWRNRLRFPNVPGRGYTTQRLLTPAEKDRIEESLRSTDISDAARSSLDGIIDAEASAARARADEIIESWEVSQQIPSDADRFMLARGRDALHRDLSIQEKRYLRQRFVDALRERAQLAEAG